MFTRLNAAIVAVYAQAVQPEGSLSGAPGEAMMNNMSRWGVGFGYSAAVLAVVYGAVMFVASRAGRNSHGTGHGLSFVVGGLITGFIISNAANIVNFFSGATL